MVISHNLLAMNAQRQFNITGIDKKKTIEKLSSGYRINRAADDAAGLSISEKMRKQIRGLDQGSRNIQDGISLIQVADGALCEVHDMLHRMTELSVKAANGTNSVSDRKAIQKEINQIRIEIDRIGDTTEFNCRKLFKSDSKDMDKIQSATGVTNTEVFWGGVSHISCSGNPTDDSITVYTFDGNSNGLLINGDLISWSNIKASNGDGIDSGKSNIYSCDYNGITFSFDTQKASTIEDICTSLKTAKVELNVSSTSGESALASLSWDYWTAINNSSGKTDYFNNVKNGNILTADNNGVSWKGKRINWTDTNDSGKTLADMLQIIENSSGNKQVGGAWRLGNGLVVNVVLKSKDVKGKSYDEVTDILKNQINGATFDIYSTGEQVSNYNAATFGVGNPYQDEHGVWRSPFDITFASQGPITNSRSAWEGLGYDIYSIYDESLEVRTVLDLSDIRNTRISVSNGTNTIYGSLTRSSIERMNNQGSVIHEGESLSLDWLYDGSNVASATIRARKGDLSLADAFAALTNETNNRNIGNPKHVYTKLAVSNLNLSLTQGSTSYSYEYTQPTLNEREIEAEKKEEKRNTNSEGMNRIWIQCGSEAGDGMYITIGEMNTKKLGINDLDVLSEENARNALDKVSDANGILSGIRARIGAQQNRLEHTYKNVTNIAENTQAAESRIRDTDMAKEMVHLSTHNILEQAGTTMIAQANQTNQGVLNLL